MGVGQWFAPAQRAGQRAGLGLAQRGMGVPGKPLQRTGQLIDQQRCVVAPVQRRAQPFGRRLLAALDDYPDQLARPKRHAHPAADPVRTVHVGVLEGQVIEQLRQRHWQGDAQGGDWSGHPTSLTTLSSAGSGALRAARSGLFSCGSFL